MEEVEEIILRGRSVQARYSNLNVFGLLSQFLPAKLRSSLELEFHLSETLNSSSLELEFQ